MTAGATGEMINDPILQQLFMARRSRRMKNKIEPSALTLTFTMPSTTANTIGTHFVDLSQVASLINRRFYRQGINWAVAGIKFVSPSREPMTGYVSSQILVSKLPNTWVMNNAWTKGFRTWQKMNREALAETESVRPKFLDFKIYADKAHHLAGYGANLLPQSLKSDATQDVATVGEWEPSKFIWTDPSAATASAGVREMEVIAVGQNFPGGGASALNAVSLVEGYAASRGLPNIADPNTPDDAALASGPSPENWMAAIFNDGTEQDSEVIEDMITQNNVAPYPFENGPDGAGGTFADTQYPGGANQLEGLEIHDIDNITSTSIGGMARIKGGSFPCGLIRIDHAVPSWAVSHGLIMTIDLIPGTHRGYLCESMLEA